MKKELKIKVKVCVCQVKAKEAEIVTQKLINDKKLVIKIIND